MKKISEIDSFLKSGVIFTPAVVGYFIGEEDKVGLGLRKKVSFGIGENLIAGIGGKVGDTLEIQGETFDQAMDREAKEEVEVIVTKKQAMGSVRFIFSRKPLDSKWNQRVGIYLITRWKGELKETESTKPLLFNVDNIPWDKMWADNKIWLPKVLQRQKVSATFLFDDDNKVKEYRFEKDQKNKFL